MGNSCGASSSSVVDDEVTAYTNSCFKDSVIILQANGEAMKISRKVRAGELMRDFPQHFLCQASSILLRRKSKMIPAKSILQRGKIYLLLPFPATQVSDSDVASAKVTEDMTNPLLPRMTSSTSVNGTTKFVISKVYLDRILSSDKICSSYKKKSSSSSCRRRSRASSPSSSSSSNLKDNNNVPSQRRSSITWSPALESIPESPLT